MTTRGAGSGANGYPEHVLTRYPVLVSVLFALVAVAGLFLVKPVPALGIALIATAIGLLVWRISIGVRRGRQRR